MKILEKGIFVTVEGGEGCGKSTLVGRLTKELDKLHLPYYSTREPGGTKTGAEIRRLLVDPERDHEPEVELALVTVDRAFHMDAISDALAAGEIVISDRFTDSTWAYQGWARGLPIGMVERVIEAVCRGISPDVTYYLKVDPNVGLARVNKRPDENSRFDNEKYDFHLRLYAGFDRLATLYPDRIVTIDANQDENMVLADVWTDFSARFLEGA
jgi:dTMP kinase